MKKAIIIILQKVGNFKELELLVFKFISIITRRVLSEVLELTDEVLMEKRDKKRLEHKDERSRTIYTIFGPLEINRRYYYDKKEGEYRFLLDEHFNLPPKDRKSPAIKELSVLMLKDESYRKSAEKICEKAEISLSHTSIWKWIQQLGLKLRKEIETKKENLFKWGTLPEGEDKKRKVDYLFAEADGTYINLQNEDKKSGEIKLGITYEGWKKRHPMSEENELVNKKYYGGEFDSTEFWKEVETKIYENYEAGTEIKTILNGDGASWIDTGKEYVPNLVLRNLDEFHINRRIFQVLGGSRYIERIQKAIENEDKKALKKHLQQAKSYRHKKKDKKKVEKLKKYLLNHWGELIDYRKKEIELPEDAQGMGGIESNIDKIIANRFKKKGMRWTKQGSMNLLKVILAEENGELEEKIEQQNWYFEKEKLEKSYEEVEEKIKKKNQAPPQEGRLPVIDGPHAGEEWVKAFKKIADPILNNPISKGVRY